MSLKAFHIFFISCSALLALGIGGWCLRRYLAPEGTGFDLTYAILSLSSAAGLLVYGRFVLKKLKHITYL